LNVACCTSSQFQCANGTCIEKTKTCDGTPNCFDASDEYPKNMKCAPPEWKCNKAYWMDGSCDCGCGVVDPDCSSAERTACKFCAGSGSCSTEICPGTISPHNNAQCSCSPGQFVCGDGTCIDKALQCNGTSNCPDGSDEYPKNAFCAPPGWACTPTFYGDGMCDCGCGIVDSDCADATVASCQFCGGWTGSCSPITTCPSNINPTNNAVCL
jgi:hypothetical protein